MFLFFWFAAGATIASTMLVLAGFTFTVCAVVPALQRHAVTAPVAALMIAPSLPIAASAVYMLEHHMFILGTAFPYPYLELSLIGLLLIAVLSTAAWIAILICRAILEYVPPFLTSVFNLKPLLLLQAALWVGSVCSALVQIATFSWLTYYFRSQLPLATAIGIAGICCAGICLRVLVQIARPEVYAPVPIPLRLKRLFFQPRTTPSS